MKARYRTQSGQALVLVTVALVAMTGIMGLAVDLGWMFFVKKQAQSAADAAALAAVEEAKMRMGGQFSGFACPSTPSTTTPWCNVSGTLECSGGGADVGTASNLYNGCLYASRNGFSHSTNSRQSVWMQAYDATNAPPGLAYCTGSGAPVPCYAANSLAYWVSVSIVQTVPQLFSAVLGNTQGTIAATGTAAVISIVVPGQFIATNTPGAWIQGNPKNVQGQDVVLQGSSSLVVPGGIVLDTTCTGSSQTGCSGVGTTTGGSSSVTSESSVEIAASGAAAGANVSPAQAASPRFNESGTSDPRRTTLSS